MPLNGLHLIQTKFNLRKQFMKLINLTIMAFVMFTTILSFAERGGESTGGGDARNQLLPPQAIVQTIADTKLPLYLFLHRAESRFQKGNSAPFLAALFSGNQDPFSILENMKVEARQGSDCEDSRKEHKDGSADVNAQKICLSVDRLSKKLSNNESGQLEVAALVAHEFTHLLGADEAGAQAVQSEFLGSNLIGDGIFFRAQNRDWIFDDAQRLRENSKWLLRDLNKLASGPMNQDAWKELDSIARTSFDSLSDLARHFYGLDQQVFGQSTHFRPERALGDLESALVSSIFYELNTCAIARSQEKPWSSWSPSLSNLKRLSGYECRQYFAPIFERSKSVRLSRFFGFLKGEGIVSAVSEIALPIQSEPVFTVYEEKNSAQLLADLRQFIGDSSRPGTLAHLVNELELLVRPEFSRFRLEK